MGVTVGLFSPITVHRGPLFIGELQTEISHFWSELSNRFAGGILSADSGSTLENITQLLC